VLMDAAARAARDHHVDCVVQGLGSMFQIVFTAGRPTHYRDMFDADLARFGRFRHALLERGVHANNSGLACWFVSAAHTDDDAALAAAAIDAAMAEAAG
jgi:glutamate-1-semialdehyde 2,1-aminomutase